jgi:hypothetical protein
LNPVNEGSNKDATAYEFERLSEKEKELAARNSKGESTSLSEQDSQDSQDSQD